MRAIFDFFYYWAIKLKFLVQRYLGQLNTTSKLKKYEFLIALEVVFSILGCFRLEKCFVNLVSKNNLSSWLKRKLATLPKRTKLGFPGIQTSASTKLKQAAKVWEKAKKWIDWCWNCAYRKSTKIISQKYLIAPNIRVLNRKWPL